VAAALRSRWNGGAGSVVMAGDSAGNHIMNATMHGVGISYGYLYFNADLPNPTPIASFATFGDTRDGTSALRYFDNGGTMKGLGFLPTTLLSDTHFDARSGRLGRLAAAMQDLGIKQGLGVDENTGVLVDTSASTAKVFGGGTLTVVDANAATCRSIGVRPTQGRLTGRCRTAAEADRLCGHDEHVGFADSQALAGFPPARPPSGQVPHRGVAEVGSGQSRLHALVSGALLAAAEVQAGQSAHHHPRHGVPR
jgi:hypothetical protein